MGMRPRVMPYEAELPVRWLTLSEFQSIIDMIAEDATEISADGVWKSYEESEEDDYDEIREVEEPHRLRRFAVAAKLGDGSIFAIQLVGSDRIVKGNHGAANELARRVEARIRNFPTRRGTARMARSGVLLGAIALCVAVSFWINPASAIEFPLQQSATEALFRIYGSLFAIGVIAVAGWILADEKADPDRRRLLVLPTDLAWYRTPSTLISLISALIGFGSLLTTIITALTR